MLTKFPIPQCNGLLLSNVMGLFVAFHQVLPSRLGRTNLYTGSLEARVLWESSQHSIKSFLQGWGEPTRTLVPWRQGFRHPTRSRAMLWDSLRHSIKSLFQGWGEPTHILVPWRQGFRHPTRSRAVI